MHGMQWQLKGRLIFGLKGRMKEVNAGGATSVEKT